MEEKFHHINYLELLGAFLVVKSFCQNKEALTVHLWMDNSSTIAYVNHLGGTRSQSLCNLVIDLWAWCLERRIFLIASHLPEAENMITDSLSRSVVDCHDWILNHDVFRQHSSLWGPLEVDLFATRISKQLPRYFSWKPDPHEETIDAFTQVWLGLRDFANPPWSLIGRCIQQIKQQKAIIVLVSPLWPSQPWFSALLPL